MRLAFLYKSTCKCVCVYVKIYKCKSSIYKENIAAKLSKKSEISRKLVKSDLINC